MQPIEIIVIILCVLIVGGVLGSYIYKKIKHLPTGDCANCKANMQRAMKKFKRECNCKTKN